MNALLCFHSSKEIPFMSNTFCFAFKVFQFPTPCTNKCHRLDSSSSFHHLQYAIHKPSTHLFVPLIFPIAGLMIPELEKPRVTEIQVRMDCNGCIQKIKKALHGINGIYDFNIDFPQQKLTIIGWADPEKIVKALKKTRKIATICSHVVPTDQPPAPPTEQAPQEGGEPAPDAPNPPPPEVPPAEAAPPPDPPKDPPLPPDNPPAETAPPPRAPDNNTSHPTDRPTGPKDVGEVHVIYRHPPDYGYRYSYSRGYGGDQHKYHTGQGLPQEPPQPIHVTHSYNTYRPSPYVTEYEYVRSPPRRVHYSRMENYSTDDNHNNSSSNGNIISIFSEENPNACRIM